MPFLSGIQDSVLFTAFQELFMRSLCEHPPVGNEEDPVAVSDGGKPVCDDDNGPCGVKACDSLLNPALRCVIESRGGFI